MADQQYDNEMRGVLFKNDKAAENPKAPQYKGQGQLNGVEVWISAWVQKSQRGQSYMSLQFELKEGQSWGTGQGSVEADVPIDTSDFGTQTSALPDDDIPF